MVKAWKRHVFFDNHRHNGANYWISILFNILLSFPGEQAIAVNSRKNHWLLHNIPLVSKTNNLKLALMKETYHVSTKPWSAKTIFSNDLGFLRIPSFCTCNLKFSMQHKQKHYAHFAKSLSQLRNQDRQNWLKGRSIVLAVLFTYSFAESRWIKRASNVHRALRQSLSLPTAMENQNERIIGKMPCFTLSFLPQFRLSQFQPVIRTKNFPKDLLMRLGGIPWVYLPVIYQTYMQMYRKVGSRIFYFPDHHGITFRKLQQKELRSIG